MKFLVDECTGSAVARWLKEQGHDVFSVYDQARGIDDDGVAQIAQSERRIQLPMTEGLERKSFANDVHIMASFFFVWLTNEQRIKFGCSISYLICTAKL